MPDDFLSPEGDAVRLSRADFALLRQAARQRWGVPDHLKTEALVQAAKLITDPNASERNKLAAMKLLATLDRIDQADDKLDLERSKLAKPTDTDCREALLSEAERVIDGHGT